VSGQVGKTGNSKVCVSAYLLLGSTAWFAAANLTPRERGLLMDLRRYLELQDREIEKHKWIESEKAGRDLGSEAVIDWIHKYAALFSAHVVTSMKQEHDFPDASVLD
jgi:hypothetical protein